MTTRKKRDAMPDPLAATPAPTPVQADLTAPDPNRQKNQLAVIYGPIEQGLALLREKHGGVLTAKPIVTAENVEAVKASHKELVSFRTRLEATRKAEKEESLRYGQAVDAEAKRIQEVATPIEKAYKDALDAYAFAEQERKDGIMKRISQIRTRPQDGIGKSADELRAMVTDLEGLVLTEFQEFREQAATAQYQAVEALKVLLRDRVEADEAKARAEAEARERERIEGIRQRIRLIGSAAAMVRQARKAETIEKAIVTFETMNPSTTGVWAELQAEAQKVYDDELASLRALLAERRKAEADAAELVRLREKAEADARELAEFRRKAAEQAAEAERLKATPAPTPAPTEAPAPLEPSERVVIEPHNPADAPVAAVASAVLNQALQDPAIVDEARAHVQALDDSAAIEGEPEAAERLPREGGLFRVTSIGQDASGAMLAEMEPSDGTGPGVVRVTPDADGPGVVVEGMSVGTDFGLMPPPPDAADVIQHLSERYDDHPYNIVQMLRAFDWDALAEQFR